MDTLDDTATAGNTSASGSAAPAPLDLDGLPGCPTCMRQLIYVEDATTWARYDLVRLDDGRLAYDVDTQDLDAECEFINGRLVCPGCVGSWPVDGVVEV